MRGLLAKDIRMLLSQKQFFTVILAIAVLFSVSGQDLFFIVGYCTMMCTFFTISTLSYDEFNNGYQFLFTLPVSRKGYALSKYLFAFLTGGSVWLVVSLAAGILGSFRDSDFVMLEWMSGSLAIFAVSFVFLCVVLPLQFKFGSEKGRIVMIVISFSAFALVMFLGKYADAIGSRINFEWMSGISAAGWIAMGVASLAVLTLISMLLSIRIMERKQF